ncbi:glycerol-3-phosphate dehydrogenase [Rhodobium gokarnense]|uniref:Glycerol-3-phosphate dehydrogenase n=1 Tax=Rhodobium gokarnense TaxID=364296 RepID=A0ABT3H9V9_9HYPH|nr:glycerol-3-phosphate dehydrogenase [Rhodobium gokarnense]MCW2307183.1 glycerol-3-phosphate dehydrogenase [Rhodobium gokarnense]
MGNAFDIVIIGGGINGCGIARDAAGRGYSVCLAEMNDLASATSSGSTKLIHGGLRYLEYYEFRLVREALKEREVLWHLAPHIIWPLRFVLPHHKGLRPAWLLRLGLFLYDHLGGRCHLGGTRTIDMRTDAAGKPLKPLYSKAFEYSDCWVNDARLVVLNARDAADRGATILPRTKAISARREDGRWQVTLEAADGRQRTVSAKLLVNAAGPWVDNVLGEALGRNEAHHIRLVQGSHIVVKRLFDHDRCYIFQNSDGRIIFAIPYEDDFTLIGTTDRDYEGDPAKVAISADETAYLCDAASDYFAEAVTTDDVVWTYSAVRPLYDDGATAAHQATRDYVLKVDDEEGAAPVINIFGGKITTYRKLAETVLERIGDFLGERGAPWTETAPLPGGDFAITGYDDLVAELRKTYPFLEAEHAARLVRLYGTRAWTLLGAAANHSDLGAHFGYDLYEVEVRYLVENEWATTADDILWRRTKRGLRLTQDNKETLAHFLKDNMKDGRLAAAQ